MTADKLKKLISPWYFRIFLVPVLSLFLIVFLTSCEKADAPKENRPQVPFESEAADDSSEVVIYEVKGVIHSLLPEKKKFIARHDEIPDYMPEMTMPFHVRRTEELEGLSPNDMIEFQLLVTEEDAWVRNIKKTGVSFSNSDIGPPEETSQADDAETAVIPEKEEGSLGSEWRAVREAELLTTGDVFPDYSLLNEFGKPVKFSDFRGKVISITMIFTRCPIPYACPRMSNQFREVQLKINNSSKIKPSQVQFLSISFDPEFDTPAVMKAYAEAYRYVPSNWSFLTGKQIDIDSVVDHLGMGMFREDGTINHQMRTVVLDAQGQVFEIINGYDWKPEELLQSMIKAAGSSNSGSTEKSAD